MTATYDITTSVGKVRLTIGDTDVSPSTDAVFTDEELTYFLSLYSDDVYMASADALEAWAAKYATNADSEHIGNYAYTQKVVDKITALAKQLREKAVSIPYGAAAEIAYTDFNFRDIVRNYSLRSG